MMRLTWAAVGGIVGSVLVLAGCAGRTITFKPGDLDLPPCVDRSPVRVEDFGASARADCDLSGVDIVFPDGYVVIAPSLGARTTQGTGAPTEYTLHNLGIYGVAAVLSPGNGQAVLWWGTEDGVRMDKDFFGPDGPNRISG